MTIDPQNSIGHDPDRGGYVFELEGTEGRYRAVVPNEMLDDELGADASETERTAWLEANLASILGAVTARETGGVVREPWGRVLVEELP